MIRKSRSLTAAEARTEIGAGNCLPDPRRVVRATAR
jgi:hypothetical protein